MHNFNYLEPTSIEEASQMLIDMGDEEVRLIAGGTALILTLRQRMVRPQHLISLSNIERLRGISFDPTKGLRIGALSRHADVANSSFVQNHYSVLASMAKQLANPQVRNQGTIGGNLCYGDPSTDPPSCLLALNATVVLGSVRGERELPLSKFLVDYFETALEDDEILVEIKVPPLADDAQGLYTRFLRTAAEHRPLVSVAFVARGPGGVCHDARLSVGASVPVPSRFPEAETFLEGKIITHNVARQAADLVADSIQPLSDSRGNENYRREMVRVVARRSITQLFNLPEEGTSA